MANPTILDRPAPTYAEARTRFLGLARAAGAEVTSHPHPTHRGPDEGELAIDVARLGPAAASAALLVVSGTHGVEGYAGSALQSRWLADRADWAGRADGPAVILVHALNPYGFAWTRRTNEDNVDLNRNFIDWNRPAPVNEGYGPLADLLVPDRWDDETRASTTDALLAEAGRMGLPEFQRVVTCGQYDHPGGVFYGGNGPTWSNRWLAGAVGGLLAGVERLGVVDLHTGLGPWGHGELIIGQDRDDPVYRRAAAWWGDVRSMRDGESVSAVLDGDWLDHLPVLCPEVEITAAALEFGTIDPFEVLQALRGEAWLHARGASTSAEPDAGADTDAEAVRAGVRRAFVDDDPAWLATIDRRFRSVLDAALEALGG